MHPNCSLRTASKGFQRATHDCLFRRSKGIFRQYGELWRRAPAAAWLQGRRIPFGLGRRAKIPESHAPICRETVSSTRSPCFSVPATHTSPFHPRFTTPLTGNPCNAPYHPPSPQFRVLPLQHHRPPAEEDGEHACYPPSSAAAAISPFPACAAHWPSSYAPLYRCTAATPPVAARCSPRCPSPLSAVHFHWRRRRPGSGRRPLSALPPPWVARAAVVLHVWHSCYSP